ncbi:tape measure protein [Morganella morganii]|uniref:tape measure protein n=1 Tax=Morganella morganii TaxID=582 RepID=UPI0023688B0D|nr:tape measure protein [Morganella morganii]
MAQVGEIVYQVQMDVAQLLTSQRQLDQRLRSMEGGFDRATRSVNDTENAMFSLSKAAALVTSALSAGAIIHAVDEWGQMAARIKMALNSVEGDVERYSEIQERFLEVSNRNGKAIETVQALYAGSATSMKELGYNTTQTVDYIESLSSAFTANATGAQQTESAMNALNRAMVVGTLKGNDWHSVLNATPSVVNDIAKELSRLSGGAKVTENDVKKMAMESGISMQLFADAMINARQENNALADSMDNTVADGFTKLANSAKAYYGELNQAYGVTRTISAGFAILSDSFDNVATAAMVAASIVGARYVGALQASAASQAKKVKDTFVGMAATKQAARVEIEAATATINRVAAEKALAVTVQQSLSAQLAAATTEEQRTRIRRELAVNSAVITGLTQQETVATNSLAAAQSRLNIASGLASKALSLIGGPVGAAMLAGAAVYYFFQKAEEAKRSAHEFADSLNELRASMDKMSRTELAAKIADAKNELDVLTDAQRDAEEEVNNLKTAYKAYSDGVLHLGSTQDKLETISRKLAKAEENLERVQNDRSKTVNFISAAQAKLSGELLQGEELLKREANTLLPNAAAALRAYGLDLDGATKAKQKFNSESLKVQWSDAGADMKKTLEREIEMAGAKNDVVKRQLQVKYYVEDKGISGQEAEKLDELAVKAGEASESQRKNNNVGKESSKAANTARDALKGQSDALARLNTGYREGSVELAKYDAAKALGDDATPAQIAQTEKLAAEKFAIEQRSADQKAALDANVLAKAKQTRDDDLAQLERQLKDKLIEDEQYHKRRAEINAEYAKKAAEENAKSAVTPAQEMAAQVDPVQALANEHAQKLALIKDYMNQRVITEQQGLALMNAANKEYDEQRTAAQWQLLSQQSLGYDMLTSAVDSLSGNASNAITGLITQTMSWSDAARSLGNTMLNSVVNSIVQVGVEMAKNFILGQTLGVATQAANASAAVAGGAAALAAWTPAAIAASIATMGAASASGLGAYTAAQATGAATSVGMKALTIAGARKNGGDVRGGSAYEVGEDNLPELMQIGNKLIAIPGNNGRVFSYDDVTGAEVIPKTSSGSQYITAGDAGKSVQNKDNNSGQQLPPIINVYQQVSGARADVSHSKGLNEQDVISIVFRSIAEGGMVRDAITKYTSANSKPSGGF